MKFPLVVSALLFSFFCLGAKETPKPAVKKPEPIPEKPAKTATVVKQETIELQEADPLEIKLPKVEFGAMERLQNAAYMPRKQYLDTEDGQLQSIFNMPGRDWYTCKLDPECKPVAWPDNESDLDVLTPPKKMRVYDYTTNEYVEQEFVKVRYNYKRASAPDSKEKGAIIEQKGEGWIDAASLSKTKRAPMFSERQISTDENNICKDDRVKKNLSDLRTVARAAENKSLNDISKAVKEVTGQCMIDPRQKKRRFEKGNIYDNYVMPTILKQKVPKVKKDDGTYMTSQDLVDIDSLARSMYGEMAGCFKHGLQYPMAVAKVVVNRSEATPRYSEFIKGSHDRDKSPLSKVVTTSSQFNVWMANHGDKLNPSLTMALCPPSNENQTYYKGTKPTKYETDIWDNAIRIATQAVVQRKTFNQRTSQVSGYFYTSGMGKFYNMTQVHPVVEGRKIEHNACLEVWMEKKKAVATVKEEKKSSRTPSSKKGK